MPVIVAIDATGSSIHDTGPRAFREARAKAPSLTP